jgi:palmitoyltransferase
MSAEARVILRDYQMNKAKKPPGPLGPIAPLAWNWMSDKELADQGHRVPVDDPEDKSKITPQWNPDEVDKFEQDRAYGRVSREIDLWWQAARDPNYANWVVPMPDVNFAQTRTEACLANLHARASLHYDDAVNDGYGPGRTDIQLPPLLPVDDDDGASTTAQTGDGPDASGLHELEQLGDEPEEDEEEEEDDDDESYGEGPMTGLLTEIPNILDPKQIEALHMMVKSCIFDAGGGALTRSGENLQKTRCRMFLALDCGKALLREMLVFIAVWEDMDEQSLIFQISTQIVEAIHHNALIPYAWNALRIPKDIISPAQAVLLRLVTVLLRARNGNGSYQANGSSTAHTDGQGGNWAMPPPESDEELGIEDKGKETAVTEQSLESKELLRDVKLLHFLFSTFRSRIVPECAALLNCQAQARSDARFAADFPVDTWDMERAKDGLAQFLELLAVACECVEMRKYLIEWEAVYDVLALLKGLEAGVEKKGLVTPVGAGNHDQTVAAANRAKAAAPHDPTAAAADAPLPPPPPPPTSMSPPMPEPAYRFPWAGVKGQILTIIASLLQPPAGKSTPGNPDVQMQIVRHNGIISLLNCCVYDDHNRWAKEKVQICLKWLMDGSEAANKFIKDLVAVTPPPANRSAQGPVAATQAKTRGKNGEAISGPVPEISGGTAADLAKYRLHLAGKSPAPPAAAGSIQGPQSGTPAAKVAAEIAASNKATTGKQTKTAAPKQAKAPTSASTTQAPAIRQSSSQQQAKVGTALSKATSDPPILPPLPAAPTAGPGGAGNAQSNRTPEFLHDIIGLADRAARMALGQEGDDADEEDFM